MPNNIIFNKITFFLLGLAILISISFPLINKVKKQYKVNQEVKELKDEIATLENRNVELNKLMDYLGSEQFIEEQARLKLNYKKKGESLLVIKNQDSEREESQDVGVYNFSNTKISSKTEINNPRKWLNYFFYN